MNSYQRALLLLSGGVIAFLQYLAITDEGFSENRGWATGFLIAVFLIFSGLTSNEVYQKILSRFMTRSDQVIKNQTLVSGLDRKSAARSDSNLPPFERAINEQVLFAHQQGLWQPALAKGRNLKWCAVVAFYCDAKMANADGELESDPSIWNSLIRRLTIEMLSDISVGMGDAGYAELESDAYSDLKFVDFLVRDLASWERLAGHCASLYGCAQTPDKVKALAEFLNARASYTASVVLPSFMYVFR